MNASIVRCVRRCLSSYQTSDKMSVRASPISQLPLEILSEIFHLLPKRDYDSDIVDRFGGANLGSKDGVAAGRGRGIVFLAWGAWAAKRVAKLDKVRALPPPSSPRSTNLTAFKLH